MLFATIDADLIVASSAPQAIDVDLDLTFVVQLALFVGLTLILKPLLFDPMLRLFEEREKRIDGAKLAARKIDEKSSTALAKYEGAMAKARAEGQAEGDQIRASGLAHEREILGGARATATKAIDEGKRLARLEADKVRASLKVQANAIARDLASRVLGREVQP